eukprot:TRINITY_DN6000_c0_g1_i1.p1 TRINITY_DN6000_c0_g1~~TRINITY_DN6000_c0_g1_i1.p1  ORF type:complete len:159 (+),score=7.99 TRINITY_DN6000_c0_g1_i1:103-579(+)
MRCAQRCSPVGSPRSRPWRTRRGRPSGRASPAPAGKCRGRGPVAPAPGCEHQSPGRVREPFSGGNEPAWAHGARVHVEPDLAYLRTFFSADTRHYADMQLTLTREVQLMPEGRPPEVWQEFILDIPRETQAQVSQHYANTAKWLRGAGYEERMVQLQG